MTVNEKLSSVSCGEDLGVSPGWKASIGFEKVKP